MPQRPSYRNIEIIGQLLLWVASIGLLSLIFHFYSENSTLNILEKSLVINFGFALAVYCNIYLLIPGFLKKKNYIFYVFWLLVLLTATSAFIQFLFAYPLRKWLNIPDNLASFNTSLHSAYFFSALFYVAVSTFLKLFKDWLSMQDLNFRLMKTEQQKLEAELHALKSQINPHFLFNSLNNIYSLALTKSDKVPGLIIKLSDLMRHIIYESKENYIPLSKEIEFVSNFIELQKIRLTENHRIDYTIPEEIPSGKVAPLLFEPFIDNAFKHGLPRSNDCDVITIKFSFSSNELIFNIENNFEKPTPHSTKKPGIGLKNVKQRLKLLYGPDEYDLKINRSADKYRVFLRLKLK